ncbi:uncharacterized protein MONOS_14725 [Monocercomonoides exilis]|uniref:uncharacterized protein n=1 Tax=Monocercomonoides exilis TaxID=2049356 RepID=UPI003559C5CC|nr:hypothetical protein MONOS_14725 [Monocercomonoides exilis]
MNEQMEEMNKDKFESVFSEELFNKIHQMIEEEKLSMRNAILLLKHIGYCNVLKSIWICSFEKSLLNKRFEKMIIEEEKKKEEKDEKHLADLYECFIPLSFDFAQGLILMCVFCLLKVALKKEEEEETQKEVEMALLALSSIQCDVKNELYANGIKEIIQYHQKCGNLTRLAYQSAWLFLIFRSFYDEDLVAAIVNELHFVEDARREIEDLSKCVDRKRKEEENEKRRKETKEELLLIRWLQTLMDYFFDFELWNEDYSVIIESIARVYGEASDHNREIRKQCIYFFKHAAENFNVKVDALLRGGAVDAVLEEIHQQTLVDTISRYALIFCVIISERLKKEEEEEEDDEIEEEKVEEEEEEEEEERDEEKVEEEEEEEEEERDEEKVEEEEEEEEEERDEAKKDEMEEEKRKGLKRKVLEKMEEEGYEDAITSYRGIFSFLGRKYLCGLPLNISDYFVSI